MQPAIRKHVLVFIGGGLTPVSGGVGRLMRYLMEVWDADAAAIPVRLVDSRGAGLRAGAAMQFLRAIAALVAGRLTGKAACAHLHMTTRGSAARKAILCVVARVLGLPVILHLHGADFFEFYAALPKLFRIALRAAIMQADRIVVIGTPWQRRLIQDLRIPPDRISMIMNGVPAAPRAQPLTWPPHILFLGRMCARKGLQDLIAALASPAMISRSWSATIAGDGDMAPFYDQIETCGLRSRVRMTGWQNAAQTDALLAGAAILVLPSHHEVLPMAVLEAMARGIAIVATPVGCVPDVLEDGVSACLVPPGAPAGLAAALARLIDHPLDRIRLGDAALAVFQHRLTSNAAAAQMQALYRHVMAPAPEPRRSHAAAAESLS